MSWGSPLAPRLPLLLLLLLLLLLQLRTDLHLLLLETASMLQLVSGSISSY